ncbi:MAG: hypothetical protein JWO44_2558 [Bacteroidetes bacterium]|nr:hypothetical protein [Bacteroidota bacterium]
MHFHLQFPIPPFPQQLSYSDKLMFIGSCFAESIGEKMNEQKLSTLINPHGVLYNPLAIGKAVSRYLYNDPLKEEELFFANESWNSWEHHSRFSDAGKEACLQQTNTSLNAGHEQLKDARWLFITFGSAFSYKHKESGIAVGNCHKVPQKKFTKSLLSTDEIIAAYDTLFKELKKLNPGLKIVLTVSPVRYIRDGVVENNLSKSILLQSVHRLVEKHGNVFYFPAYELVIDDLRDYRFYKDDLVHPSEQAVSYVFEKLKEVLFDNEAKELYKSIRELLDAAKHRPFNENSEAHKKFKSTFEARCVQLQKRYPFLDLKTELDHFKAI